MVSLLRGYDGPPLKIMEVCGTHTAAIMKSGIRSFLSPKIRLVSGPGCPVCVTPTSYIDACLEIAATPGHCLVSFGDMLKVPGSAGGRMPPLQYQAGSECAGGVGRTLSDALGAGESVHMVYAPFDALPLAEAHPEICYVVAAVGFETTAPAYALLMEEAEARGLGNIRLLTALKSALAAIDHICASGEGVDAFLCPGHVSVITGSRVYEPLAARYGKPFVVAGFEARHILEAVYECVRLSQRAPLVRNLYPEAVREEGNPKALALIERYFERQDAVWRGLGVIPASGYVLRDRCAEDGAAYDFTGSSGGANGKEDVIPNADGALPQGCRCGDVILGRIDPPDCPLFGASCTPARAVGPCMVSSEGACGIWFRNRG
ncbi:MAG: hydrogenase formation protein HypD [Clostridiales Family XIII bacterium]|nr:hydrogenase formation protein HypD [Clostridiales Family XIII bacterium]